MDNEEQNVIRFTVYISRTVFREVSLIPTGGNNMYQDGDILQLWNKKYIVLGIKTSNKLLYVLYPDEKKLYDKALDAKELFNITTEMLYSVSGIKVVGHKNKNKLNLWLTKNRMLYDLPFISVAQYQANNNPKDD